MAVKVVSKGPDPSVIKRVVCRNCGASLEYVPKDVQERRVSDYTGETDIIYYIDCPECKEHVPVRSC